MKKLSTALLVLLLSACSSQVSVPSHTQDAHKADSLDKPMFLRGDFTLWDAEPQYKLTETKPGIYTVRTKLMNVEKVYEFKIADKAWSKGYNCGFKTQGNLTLNKPQIADCSTVYNYFNFSPKKQGWYTITFDYRNANLPTVMVSRG